MSNDNKISKNYNSVVKPQINDYIIKSNIPYKKKRKISLNNIPKNKSSSTNYLCDSFGDDTKSKNSSVITKKKKKETNEINQRKKKNKPKITKFVKKEKLKIPIGKRMSITQNTKLNLNINNNSNSTNNLNIVKSFTPRKVENIRTDKNGIEINKTNKKIVHITFLDEITPNQITEIVNIESFKKFNIVEKKQSKQASLSDYSKCCNIF